MVDGNTTLINGISCATMISGVVITTMISGIFRTIGGGPVRGTSILDVVVVPHEVASVDLVDLIGLSMR